MSQHDPTSAAAREIAELGDRLFITVDPMGPVRAVNRAAIQSILLKHFPPAPPGDGGEEIGSILREINDWDGCRVLGLVPNGAGRWEVVDVIEPELYDVAGAGIVACGSTPMEAVVKARESLIPSQPAASGGE